MENKYYTPEKEDIRVGYECQVQEIEFAQWINQIITKDWTLEGSNIYEYLEWNNVRTKYLDKEDIESLGYNQILDSECFIDSNRKLLLTFFKECNKITIFRKNGPIKVLFKGTCKSKNELITIQKLLGI